MAAKLGLPDDEIDRLLSEAEARLSGSGNGTDDAVAAAPAVKAPATIVAAPVAAAAGEPAAEPNKKSEKLSVRVPQLPQKKKTKDTLGSDWYNLPRTNLTLELKRDLQILRMRDVVAMGKQFFKKDSRKDFIPEYSQVGTIIAGATDGASGRLTRKERKRTIVEEVLSGENTNKFKSKFNAKMHPPRLIRPLRPLLQGQLAHAASRTAAVGIPRASTPRRTYASVTDETDAAKPSATTPPAAEPAKPAEQAETSDSGDGVRVSRMPRALEALYLRPLRREAQYGVPTCNLQLRAYSARNLEFFCDFALRAAYFLGLPAFGPVPLPRLTERWTVPRSTFIFKKSQENFERITLRRLIQIRDGHPETVQIWLAFLQKHAYYGIGMKANVWEFSKLGVGKEMDKMAEETEKLLEDKWYHLGYLEGRHLPEGKTQHPKLPAAEDLEEYLAQERRRIAGGRVSADGPKVICSGIQPTGVPHLGNYLGALREWKRLQDTEPPETKLIFFIADLHALTVPRPREELSEARMQLLAALLAVGLRPDRCTIFFQSSVPAHAELQWILSCTASTGYLSRMTQWKAADILVHRATHVPVGEDQRQHLEFTRECATNFRHTYGSDALVAPETLIAPSPRVMSLTNPTAKMSKSDPSPKSRILIIDSEATIQQKIRQALTDSLSDSVSYDRPARPGVSNLIDILAAFDPRGRDPAQLAREDLDGVKIPELKRRVTEALVAELGGIRDRYLDLSARPAYLADSRRSVPR
ncbi:uncharacterized protein THITE_2155551 [Thermothielavioides terrestris NRRL 8126]|uniref:Small ribosomal subunit protein uS10m n=1 Tax=Thermothielavioides terrestris (strain ATCC 38088 / NRRL 8126) TaxID=578455 RepID=G2RB33_THETT|nr:uncharacterized protein THITE_2155551 [Thermothielavioides terrestris NRRL 8126]AEO69004.1 hypothetical protein THITE_2155551 [Thermothielavioides terrestris NRRL 8126]